MIDDFWRRSIGAQICLFGHQKTLTEGRGHSAKEVTELFLGTELPKAIARVTSDTLTGK